MKLTKNILAAALAMGLASSSFGAVYQLIPVVSKSFDPATGSNATVQNNPSITLVPKGSTDRVYQVDIFMKFTGAPGQTFGGVQYNANTVTPAGSLTRPAANLGSIKANYFANNPFWDSDGDGVVDPNQDAKTYGDNADLGTGSTGTTDLVGIAVDIDNLVPTNGSDPRPALGTPVPNGSLLGSVFYRWNSQQDASLTLTPTIGQFYTASDNKVNPDAQAVLTGATVNFTTAVGTVPEPASLAGMAIGALLVVRRRRA